LIKAYPMQKTIVRIYPCYQDFLKNFYSENLNAVDLNYETQLEKIIESGFDETYDFVKHLSKLGFKVIPIISNAHLLNRQWANEYGDKKQNILIEMIMYYGPQIIIYDNDAIDIEFLQKIKNYIPCVKLLIATSCTILNKISIDKLRYANIVITCSLHIYNQLISQNLNAYLIRHGFPNRFLVPFNNDRLNNIVFVGGFAAGSGMHEGRINFISRLLKEDLPIKIYASITPRWKEYVKYKLSLFDKFLGDKKNHTNNISHLIPNNIRKFSSAALYGKEMYTLYQQNLVVLNMHAGVAGEYAANIRLFEATGSGACLLTDNKKDLHELFEVDKEVIVFNSTEEAIDKLRWLISNPQEAAKIGHAGYIKTSNKHLISNRVMEYNNIINKYL
jgi:spore maturation protein CgeB